MQKFDVIEVTLEPPRTVRVISAGEEEANAEAIAEMAVIRRGCKHSFFTTAAAGRYLDGDEYRP